MRVVALGGAGDMGRYAVRTAVGYDFVDEIVVADLELSAAERVARRTGTKARATAVDAADAAGLRNLLRGADVVLNTVGPFYRFGVPILEAAIDAGDLSVEEAAAQMEGPVPPELRKAAASESAGVRLPPLFAVARGRRGSESVDVGALVLGMPAGGMGGATGVPLAVGLSLFARGRLERRGVFAPEGVIDPDAFFDELAPLCSPAFGSGREMLATTESGRDAAGDAA